MSLLKRLGTIVDECTAEYEKRRGTAALKTMVRKDPLSLVDFWTVAIGCGGSVYRPELIICREKDGLKAVAEIPVKREDIVGLTAAVKVWDVFGGCGFLPLSAEHADLGETEQK